MSQTSQPIILFDGECKLCSAWVPFVIKRDPDAVFRFCSVQSPAGQKLLRSIGLPTDHFQTMVLLIDDNSLYKSEAFFRFVQSLKQPWPLLKGLTIFPLSMRDWLYDRIALNRYQIFGRNNYCMIATAEIKERFVD